MQVEWINNCYNLNFFEKFKNKSKFRFSYVLEELYSIVCEYKIYF